MQEVRILRSRQKSSWTVFIALLVVPIASSASEGRSNSFFEVHDVIEAVNAPSDSRRKGQAFAPNNEDAARTQSGSALGDLAAYEYFTVASEGEQGITDMDPDVSINDFGKVAFIGTFPDPAMPTEDLHHIFVGNGAPASLLDISPGLSSTFDPDVGPSVQINNLDQVGVRVVYHLPLGVITSYVQAWNASVPGQMIDLVYAEPILGEFDGIYAFPSINSTPATLGWGGVAFSALDGGNNHLGTLTSSGAFRIQLNGDPPHLMVADNNHFVMRRGTNHITLLPPAFLPFTDVATTSNGWFSAVGERPGISDQGSVVAFYGDLTQAGAGALASVPGPGVFAATIDYGSVPPLVTKIVRVAGNLSFQPDSRVSVTDPLGDQGEEAYVVCFAATPNDGNTGLFTVRVDADSLVGPLPVAQVGDQVAGATISDIAAPYDAISRVPYDESGAPRDQEPGDHQVAFWVNTSAGQKVVRAVHHELDTDADALYDHWELDGIPFSDDASAATAGGIGGIGFFSLPNANPVHKDLYVEVDAMQGHLPSMDAIQLVVDSFAARNVTLHVMQDELDIAPSDYSSDPFSAGDFYSDQRFGTAAERAAGLGVLQAKAKAVRYCLYAKNTSKDIYGQAEPAPACSSCQPPYNPSQSFIVFKEKYAELAAQQGVLPTDPKIIKREAATFMHELGHTLGLAHGGSQAINFKPNYRSVMNNACTEPFNSFQVQFTLDYSDRAYPPLNPCALDEAAGIQGDPGKWVVIGPEPQPPFRPLNECMGTPYNPPIGNYWDIRAETGPIRWNGDSDENDTVVRDVRWRGFNAPDMGLGGTIMSGHDDWANLAWAPPGRVPSSPVPPFAGAGFGEEESPEVGVAYSMVAFSADSDCNDNQIPDRNDILDGTSMDENENGVPDECEDLQTSVPVSDVAVSNELIVRALRNPGTRSARIAIAAVTAGTYDCQVFDVTGRVVRTVFSGVLAAGDHVLAWDGRDQRGDDVASGVYIVRVTDSLGAGATTKITIAR